MTRRVLVTIVVVAVVALLAGAACGTQTPVATQTPATEGQGTVPEVTSVSKTTPVSIPEGTIIETVPGQALTPGPTVIVERVVGPSPGYNSSVPYLNATQQAGIWVTGRGEITVEPDMAILSAGVEASAATVAEANSQAAGAMNRVVQVLNARGIQDRDIETRFFSIRPEYRYNDRLRKQELVGYMVSNQVSVTIRDLDNIGPIIDEVAAAGGDLTRIQGISFTVEDTSALETQVREIAVTDALSKAQHFAQLTDVNVGPLMWAHCCSSANRAGVCPGWRVLV